MNSKESLEEFVTILERQNLTEVFWNDTLPSKFDNANTNSTYWILYTVAQKYLGNQSFLTSTLVRDMKTAQVHHIYPKSYLRKNGFSNKNMYNKLANYVYLHDQVNNKVSDYAPADYMAHVTNFEGAFGNEIKNKEELKKNLNDNAVPEIIFEGTYNNYLEFLSKRAIQMALKIKSYYEKL